MQSSILSSTSICQTPCEVSDTPDGVICGFCQVVPGLAGQSDDGCAKEGQGTGVSAESRHPDEARRVTEVGVRESWEGSPS